MNVIVIAPHPDDEAIGCGGSIRLHVEQGDRVGVVFLTSGELGIKAMPAREVIDIREREAQRSAEILGFDIITFARLPDSDLASHLAAAASVLRPIFDTWKPQQIYLPHPAESHPDHQACKSIVEDALKGQIFDAPWLLGYEVWTPMPEFDNTQDVTRVWDTKLQSILAYRSQLASFAYDRAAAGLAMYRGALAHHCEFAEVQTTL